MTEDEKLQLELTINGAKDNWDELTEWEQSFMMSIEEKFLEYGDRARVSVKQWGILNRIYDKVAE